MELIRLWNRMSAWPGGRCLFSILLGFKVPYTGTLGAQVLELSPGSAKISLRDRRAVRNHLGSVHAIALVNLGEFASGLAVLSSLPPGLRGIVTRLEIDYLKKAKGNLVASSDFRFPEGPLLDSYDFEAEAKIFNQDNELVAQVKAHWRISSGKSK
jgi:acyl-coenzyme A thioesterase PaaI-like protein